MQAEEQQLIDGLFSRLKDAERQSDARDSQVEQYIQQRLRDQPAAPYYMAQVVLIQEAALKRLEQQVQNLEAKVTQLQQSQPPVSPSKPSSGGFLSSLFGSSNSAATSAPAAPTAPAARGWSDPGPRYNTQPSAPTAGGWGQPQPAAPARSGGGFLAGAAQTAAGVAGGMLLAETVSSFFHDKPEPVAEHGASYAEPVAAAPAPVEQPSARPVDDYTQTDYNSDESDFFDDSDDDSFV